MAGDQRRAHRAEPAPAVSTKAAPPSRARSGDLGDFAQGFFLHIPKTAGRSFGQLLRRETAIGKVLRVNGDDIFPGLASASDYALVQGHVPYPVGALLEQPLFVMTFLRHPVNRALSLLEYGMRRPEKPMFNRLRTVAVEDPIDLVDEGIASNRQTNLLGAEYDLAPVLERFRSGELSAREARRELQGLWTRPDRETLERAKRRLERIEFIGLTEAFDDSLRLFAERIGMTSPPTAYRVNIAPGGDPQTRKARYDTEALEVVAKANRLDLELYEFGVELFTRRYKDAFGEAPDVTVPG